MYKAYFIFILFSFSLSALNAQENLVLNPSFEDTLTDYDNTHLYLCKDWIVPTGVSSDWFSTDPNALCNFCCCSTQAITNFGNQPPVTGEAITGIILYTDPVNSSEFSLYKEYIEGSLSEDLVIGQIYFISLYMSLADSSKFAVDKLGIHFTNQVIDLWSAGDFSTSQLNFQPQVEFVNENYFQQNSGWTHLTASYTATGGERYFVLGSFQPNDTMVPLVVNESSQGLQFYSHYFFDDISISTDSAIGVFGYSPPCKIIFSNGCLYLPRRMKGSCSIYDLCGRSEKTVILREQVECISELAVGLHVFILRNENGLVLKKGFVQID